MAVIRAGSVAACLALVWLAGCAEEPLKVDPAPGKYVVETYGQASDPTTQPSGFIRQPGPPLLIENGSKSTIIYTCRNARCEILKEAIENFASPEGTVQASPQLNVLLVSDSREMAPALLKMIEELDRPQPQLLVEARILEITLDSDFEYEMKILFKQEGFKEFWQTSGIVLNTPGGSANPTQGGSVTIRPLVNDHEFLDLFIRLLVTKGRARILSSPNLIVGAGSEASIITGEEVPIQSATVVSGSVSTTTIFKRVGIKLNVLPLQISGNMAKLEINPEVSAVTGYTAPGSSGVSNPIVAVRNVRSSLTMKDGQVLTIGGLLRSEDRKIVKKVPVLGDILLVGYLFQSHRVQSVNTQLIFFLRVKILPEAQPDDFLFHRPGSGLEGAEHVRIGPASAPAVWEPASMPAPRVIRMMPPSEAPAGDSLPTTRPATGPDMLPPPKAPDDARARESISSK